MQISSIQAIGIAMDYILILERVSGHFCDFK